MKKKLEYIETLLENKDVKMKMKLKKIKNCWFDKWKHKTEWIYKINLN